MDLTGVQPKEGRDNESRRQTFIRGDNRGRCPCLGFRTLTTFYAEIEPMHPSSPSHVLNVDPNLDLT